MKILIVSDSHGSKQELIELEKRVRPIDRLIHLGDSEMDQRDIASIFSCPLDMVAGNNDYFTTLQKEKIITLASYRIWLTHGHRYAVYCGTKALKEEAKRRNVQMVFFGHTHVPVIDLDEEIIAVNPGSIARPRQPGRQKTYVLMEIDRFGKAHFHLNIFS